MRDRGVPPSDAHYITVVDGLVRAGRWEDAQKVYRAAREEGRAGAEVRTAWDRMPPCDFLNSVVSVKDWVGGVLLRE